MGTGHLFIFKQLSTQNESQIAYREEKKKTLLQISFAVNEWEVRNAEHWFLLSIKKNISCLKNETSKKYLISLGTVIHLKYLEISAYFFQDLYQ